MSSYLYLQGDCLNLRTHHDKLLDVSTRADEVFRHDFGGILFVEEKIDR